LPPKEYLGRAKAAAQKALQLDDQLAEAHASYGAPAPAPAPAPAAAPPLLTILPALIDIELAAGTRDIQQALWLAFSLHQRGATVETE